MTLRIGSGYDVHRLVSERPLILCGVHIPYEKGEEAHSDGDVALHALCDALLGALALGDIGKLFPDSDPLFKNVDSRLLLRHVYSLLQKRDWKLINCDLTILLQSPKLRPYIDLMRENIASDLCCNSEQISIKATTTERLGFVGRGDGVAAEAVVLVGHGSY
jgi:ygbB family